MVKPVWRETALLQQSSRPPAPRGVAARDLFPSAKSAIFRSPREPGEGRGEGPLSPARLARRSSARNGRKRLIGVIA